MSEWVVSWPFKTLPSFSMVSMIFAEGSPSPFSIIQVVFSIKHMNEFLGPWWLFASLLLPFQKYSPLKFQGLKILSSFVSALSEDVEVQHSQVRRDRDDGDTVRFARVVMDGWTGDL